MHYPIDSTIFGSGSAVETNASSNATGHDSPSLPETDTFPGVEELASDHPAPSTEPANEPVPAASQHVLPASSVSTDEERCEHASLATDGDGTHASINSDSSTCFSTTSSSEYDDARKRGSSEGHRKHRSGRKTTKSAKLKNRKKKVSNFKKSLNSPRDDFELFFNKMLLMSVAV